MKKIMVKVWSIFLLCILSAVAVPVCLQNGVVHATEAGDGSTEGEAAGSLTIECSSDAYTFHVYQIIKGDVEGGSMTNLKWGRSFPAYTGGWNESSHPIFGNNSNALKQILGGDPYDGWFDKDDPFLGYKDLTFFTGNDDAAESINVYRLGTWISSLSDGESEAVKQKRMAALSDAMRKMLTNYSYSGNGWTEYKSLSANEKTGLEVGYYFIYSTNDEGLIDCSNMLCVANGEDKIFKVDSKIAQAPTLQYQVRKHTEDNSGKYGNYADIEGGGSVDLLITIDNLPTKDDCERYAQFNDYPIAVCSNQISDYFMYYGGNGERSTLGNDELLSRMKFKYGVAYESAGDCIDLEKLGDGAQAYANKRKAMGITSKSHANTDKYYYFGIEALYKFYTNMDAAYMENGKLYIEISDLCLPLKNSKKFYENLPDGGYKSEARLCYISDVYTYKGNWNELCINDNIAKGESAPGKISVFSYGLNVNLKSATLDGENYAEGEEKIPGISFALYKMAGGKKLYAFIEKQSTANGYTGISTNDTAAQAILGDSVGYYIINGWKEVTDIQPVENGKKWNYTVAGNAPSTGVFPERSGFIFKNFLNSKYTSLMILGLEPGEYFIEQLSETQENGYTMANEKGETVSKYIKNNDIKFNISPDHAEGGGLCSGISI